MKTLPQRKNMKNSTITLTKYEKPEKYEKHKIYGLGWEAGETPTTLAALAAPAAPTENRIMPGLTAFFYYCACESVHGELSVSWNVVPNANYVKIRPNFQKYLKKAKKSNKYLRPNNFSKWSNFHNFTAKRPSYQLWVHTNLIWQLFLLT